MKNVYLLECWTHELYPNRDGKGHDINSVGIFSSEEKALEYAKDHAVYAGNQDDWDWVITRYELDEDPEYASFPKHFNRFGEQEEDPASYTPDMEDDEEDLTCGSCNDEDNEDPVVVKDGTISVSQPVNTQEDVDEFIGRLKKLKPQLPHREEKTTMQKIMELQAEILRLLIEDEKKNEKL